MKIASVPYPDFAALDLSVLPDGDGPQRPARRPAFARGRGGGAG
jgi:hypothetical protein